MSTRSTRDFGPSRHQSEHSLTSVHTSSTGRGSDRRSGRSGVESTVTRLLIAIRQLLEALTLWSNENATEQQVSDVYVRLGNDFNSAVAAFSKYNIDMSDLLSVPGDLREILEACLAEEANPTNLEIYLPQVRQIITNLLQGLRVKQSSYRKITEKSRQSHASRHDLEKRDHERSRSSLAGGNSASTEGAGFGGRRSYGGLTSSASSSVSTRLVPETTGEPERHTISPVTNTPLQANNEFEHLDSSERAILPETAADGEVHTSSPTITSSSFRQVGPEVTRYSLSDPPVPSILASNSEQETEQSVTPTLMVHSPSEIHLLEEQDAPVDKSDVRRALNEEPTSPTSLNTVEAPEMAHSLRALKKSETLERRASKRFSIYNFQKITGGRTGGPTNRRSIMVGGMNLTSADLATLAEDDESGPILNRKPSRELGTENRTKRVRGPGTDDQLPPVPPLPTPSPSTTSRDIDGLPSKRASLQKEEKRQLTVFLQVGREVKKVNLEPGLPLTAMRVLFMDKFTYNPGHDNFPAIYIRDPASGVQYELEDVEEVQDRCLLLLNIDPLDQIKQHIDVQITKLSSDLKDLKSTMTTSQRTSFHQVPLSMLSSLLPSEPTSRPSDKQFREAARRLSRISSADQTLQQEHIPAALVPQTTGASIITESASSLRLVSDLRVQFDEVQNLRRDLGVMRQLYTGFVSQTKESISSIRSQAQILRQIAGTKADGNRAFIDTGKTKLDGRSQNILTEVERLQDTVENLKDDVLKRQILPKRSAMQSLKTDVASASAELESLAEQLKTIKPIWKKTWEEELQNIVEEQTFLQHQEQLVQDLLEDHKELRDVFARIEKVVNIRSNTGGTGSLSNRRGFRPTPPDEGHEGLSTVMRQIRGASVDPEKRMKAIEASQKARAREQENRRGDEFEAELSGFVKGKKLRMTGGAEETERVRQKKSEATLKAMFNSEVIL